MLDWLGTGEVVLVNDPKISTSYDPVTGNGSTLDIGIVTPKLLKSVISFSVDHKKKWSPLGLKHRPGKKPVKVQQPSGYRMHIIQGRPSCKAVINYSSNGGGERFVEVGIRRAPDIEALEGKYHDINERQANLNIIKLEVDIEAFGLRPHGSII